VNLILVYLIGYSFMQLWTLGDRVALDTDSQPQFINHKQLSAPTENISALLNAHLFGKASNARVQAKPKPKPKPKTKTAAVETKLNLKLQGIFYSSKSSYAIIIGSNGKSMTYKENDSLSPAGVAGDAVLHIIYPKQVILRINGRYETLLLIGTKKNQSFIKKLETNDAIKTDKLLADYQKQLKTNPKNLLKLVRIKPEVKNGQFIGFRIEPRKNNADLFSHFKLKSGDVLTAVNNIRLDSPLKGLTVAQQLANAKQINLELLRQGRTVFLSFAIEK